MFRLQALNSIMSRDAKSSNDMHDCYWSKVFGSIPPQNAPFENLSAEELACERTGAFPCDFTFVSKNRPSNNNKYTPSVLLWPRGNCSLFFLSPDVKDIWVQRRQMKKKRRKKPAGHEATVTFLILLSFEMYINRWRSLCVKEKESHFYQTALSYHGRSCFQCAGPLIWSLMLVFPVFNLKANLMSHIQADQSHFKPKFKASYWFNRPGVRPWQRHSWVNWK